jgi:hypothetical protein
MKNKFLFFPCVVIVLIALSNPAQARYRSEQSGKSAISSGDNDAIFVELKEERLTADIKDVALIEVLKRLSDQIDVDFVLPPSLGKEKVLVRFSNSKIDEGLDKILRPYSRISLYREDQRLPGAPVTRRLTEVRILPREYKGKSPELSVRISGGTWPGEEQTADTRKKKQEIKNTAVDEEKTSLKTLAATLNSRNRIKSKLEAIAELEKVGTVKAVEALAFALRDKNTTVRDKAVDTLKKIGDGLINGEDLDDDVIPDPPDPSDNTLPEPGNARLNPGSVKGNTTSVVLDNDVPVKSLQFAVSGQPTEVRTTSRTEGFMARLDKKSGTVVLISLSGKTIAPGNGPVVEVVQKTGGPVSLRNGVIADEYGRKMN